MELETLLYKIDKNNIIQALQQTFSAIFKNDNHRIFRKAYKTWFFFQADRTTQYYVDVELAKCIRNCLMDIRECYPQEFSRFEATFISLLKHYDMKAKKEMEHGRFPGEFFLDEEDYLA